MEKKKVIAVIDGGWVALGDLDERSDRIVLTDASIIRKWGTTKGLGEIALGGPTSSTILDYAGVVEVYRHAVIMIIHCTYGAGGEE